MNKKRVIWGHNVDDGLINKLIGELGYPKVMIKSGEDVYIEW